MMTTALTQFALCFTALFVALDVIGTVPLYLSMTESMTLPERNKIVNSSMWMALVVAVAFVFAGRAVFRHLGIQLFDFKIAGGIVLLLVSLADLIGGPESLPRGTGKTGIVPLAVPLITGPSVLTTLILQVGTVGYPITLISLAVNYAFAWFILRKCEAITRLMGKDGTAAVSKIAALLLAAISVAMIRSGVFEAIIDWKK